MQLNGTLPRLLVIWHRSRIFDNCSRVWTYARLHHLASPDAQKQGEEKKGNARRETRRSRMQKPDAGFLFYPLTQNPAKPTKCK